MMYMCYVLLIGLFCLSGCRTVEQLYEIEFPEKHNGDKILYQTDEDSSVNASDNGVYYNHSF